MKVFSTIAMGAVRGVLFAGMAIAYLQLAAVLLVISAFLMAVFAA